MNKDIDLVALKQKAYRERFYLDGLTEIFIAIMLIFSPLVFINPTFIVFIPIILIFSYPITESIRNKITYPRLGRVDTKIDLKGGKTVKRSLIELFLLISLAMVVSFISLIAFNGDPLNVNDWAKYVPTFFGIIMFGPSIFLVENTGIKLFYLFGIFATFFGFVFSFLSFNDIYLRIIVYFSFMGIIFLFMGVLRLILFIKKYPIIDEMEV